MNEEVLTILTSLPLGTYSVVARLWGNSIFKFFKCYPSSFVYGCTSARFLFVCFCFLNFTCQLGEELNRVSLETIQRM